MKNIPLYYYEEGLPKKCTTCEEDIGYCYCSAYTMGVKREQRDDFVIKPSTADNPPETFICKCGSDNFKVGRTSYFTAIKCTQCGFQFCVHEG